MNNEKRTCTQCQRVLQQSIHDTCMYCGAVIPEELRLSDDEKTALKRKKEAQKKQQNAKSRSSSLGSGSSLTGISDLFGDGGGDFGGDA